MGKPSVIYYGGLTVNLADVKCFRIDTFSDSAKGDTIIVELKTRYAYIYNPASKEFEKQEYNETTEVQFGDSATAHAYMKDWVDFWQGYLDEQEDKSK